MNTPCTLQVYKKNNRWMGMVFINNSLEPKIPVVFADLGYVLARCLIQNYQITNPEVLEDFMEECIK